MPFPEGGLSDGVVILRAKGEADVEDVVEATADPQIPRYTNVPEENTPEMVRAWFEATEQEQLAGRGVHLLITDAGAGALLGAISLHEIDLGNRRAEIGYWVAAPARGRGVATRAVRLMAKYGFEILPLQRISIFAETENVGSRRVAEAAGFATEGVLRSWIDVKGDQKDVVSHRLLRSEILPPS